MSKGIPRYQHKRDANEKPIVEALRKLGCEVIYRREHTDGLTHSEKRGALKLIASMMRQYFRGFYGIEVPKFPDNPDTIPF